METPSITLRENNPYANGSIFVFDEGDLLLDREISETVRSANDRYYTIVDGDTLNKIAMDKYQNSKWWWVLYDANDSIINPFELVTGTTIYIPDLNKIKIQ